MHQVCPDLTKLPANNLDRSAGSQLLFVLQSVYESSMHKSLSSVVVLTNGKLCYVDWGFGCGNLVKGPLLVGVYIRLDDIPS